MIGTLVVRMKICNTRPNVFPILSRGYQRLQKQINTFKNGYFLMKGKEVTRSELRVSGAEVTSLLLLLSLLVYSIVIFFRIWKKNYRMPEGVFYFEEKIVQKTVKRMFEKQNKRINLKRNIISPTARDTTIYEFCALEGNRNM